MRGRGLTRPALVCAALLSLGSGDVPWPHETGPSELELLDQVEAALAVHALESQDEWLEAAEKGEDAEPLRVLQADIDAGFWDLDQLFRFGDALFGHEFRTDEGYAAAGEPVAMQRVHLGRRGGLDGFSCAGCHSVGGLDGAGALTQNAVLLGDGDRFDSGLVRNPPATIGLGLVQALAFEMSVDLQIQRDAGLAVAATTGLVQHVELVSKGVTFGSIEVAPDGSVDATELRGVDPDLVVKPFGWKGSFARLRRVVEDAARIHFGIQSHVLALGHQAAPDPEALGEGPDWWDPDGDGVARELEEGALTATAVYLAMLEAPQLLPPHDPGLRDRWAHGSAVFDQIGCADCHRRELILTDVSWDEHPDTSDGEPVTIDLLVDGDGPKGTARVQLFADLRRHDMGLGLADAHPTPGSSVAASEWLTRPLWGLAESGPYLHDGRATSIPEAILAHGGEAEQARDAFASLSFDDQADLHVFLLSLSRAPRLQVPR